MSEQLQPWEVHTFSWGTAIKHAKGRWDRAFISPSGEEIIFPKSFNVHLTNEGISMIKEEH